MEKLYINRATQFITVHAMIYVEDKETKDNQGNERGQRYVIIHRYGVKLL